MIDKLDMMKDLLERSDRLPAGKYTSMRRLKYVSRKTWLNGNNLDRQALEMVNEFVDYIARDDCQTAEKWALELMQKTDKLADQPRLERIIPEYNEETLREIIAGNYRIAYRIKEEAIYMEAVWHVRQPPGETEQELR